MKSTIGIVLISFFTFSSCSSNQIIDIAELEPRVPGPRSFDREACDPDTEEHIVITILDPSRKKEILEDIFMAMDDHGFIHLPENEFFSSENKYILPDDHRTCYFEWYGLGTDQMMFVRNYRNLPVEYNVFGVKSSWSRSGFYERLKRNIRWYGIAAELDIKDVDEIPKFQQEMWLNSGPHHMIQYDENGEPMGIILFN